jgi:UDP-N-acetylmuramate--alanine ligase
MLFRQIAIRHRRIHFVGIGGLGMSGIAEILLTLGYEISGSDLRLSPVTERLASLGARITEGHAAANIEGADAIVVSSAISSRNQELLAAREIQIPVIRRGELLAELMRLKYGIAIAGSHGKTTTTSLTAAVLNGANLDPTVVVGGRVDAIGSNARLGASDYLLVESDESDGSFLKLAPVIAAITSIDREHLNHYGSFDALKEAYVEFANKVPFYGSAVLFIDDAHVRELLPRIERRIRTYGESEDADLRATEIRCGHMESSFDLTYRGEPLGTFTVRAAGRHNVWNAMAAVLVGLELNLKPDTVREGLAAFSGVDRRFQVRGHQAGVTIIDDYGHHPTEIAHTLAAAKTCDFGRVAAIFQPHRYSRTYELADDFARCFRDCDRLYVLDIYSASEEPIPGVNAPALVEKIRSAGHSSVEYVESIAAAIDRAVADAQPGDAIITLGAGSISQAGPKLIEALTARSQGVTAGH